MQDQVLVRIEIDQKYLWMVKTLTQLEVSFIRVRG